MGRKPKAASEGDAAPAAARTRAASTGVRRTRQRRTIDHVAQTQVLVSALLKTRGGAGATSGDALSIVAWARGVHEESAALKALATRVRKVNAPGVAERQMAHEVNKALLDGVLAGTTTVDVGADGGILFGDSSAAPAPEAAAE